MSKMRIRRDVTITWEMSEDIAYAVIGILEEYDPRGNTTQEDTISLSLDSLHAALPKVTRQED